MSLLLLLFVYKVMKSQWLRLCCWCFVTREVCGNFNG